RRRPYGIPGPLPAGNSRRSPSGSRRRRPPPLRQVHPRRELQRQKLRHPVRQFVVAPSRGGSPPRRQSQSIPPRSVPLSPRPRRPDVRASAVYNQLSGPIRSGRRRGLGTVGGSSDGSGSISSTVGSASSASNDATIASVPAAR